jgi:hypothetical protein
MPQELICKNARDHCLGHGNSPNGHAGIMAAFGLNIYFLSRLVNTASGG